MLLQNAKIWYDENGSLVPIQDMISCDVIYSNINSREEANRSGTFTNEAIDSIELNFKKGSNTILDSLKPLPGVEVRIKFLNGAISIQGSFMVGTKINTKQANGDTLTFMRLKPNLKSNFIIAARGGEGGHVDDVEVDGISVVSGGVAEIELAPYAKKTELATEITGAKEYTDNKIAECVKSATGVTAGQKVYVREAGVDKTINYGSGVDLGSGTIVLRASNAQIKVPDTPTTDADATSKKYVDGKVSDLQTAINAKAAQSALEAEATQRADADTVLSTNLETYNTASIERDEQLARDLAGEATARSEADTQLGGRIDAKSTVSVSATGTSADEVSYITIDGVEKKLAGGGSGEPAEYLKTIAKDETNQKIRITDKAGTLTEFPYGSGSAQIQSDWTQEDDTKVDFIKNKPDLSVYAPITDANLQGNTTAENFSASGSVDFKDAGEIKLGTQAVCEEPTDANGVANKGYVDSAIPADFVQSITKDTTDQRLYTSVDKAGNTVEWTCQSISGSNDGTYWTNLTIDDETYDLGGGGKTWTAGDGIEFDGETIQVNRGSVPTVVDTNLTGRTTVEGIVVNDGVNEFQVLKSQTVENVVTLTKEDYEALETKDPSTLYCVTND